MKKGEPNNLREEIVLAMTPIIKKYRRTWLSNSRISGIIISTIQELSSLVYERRNYDRNRE